jgi:hypothetical protein
MSTDTTRAQKRSDREQHRAVQPREHARGFWTDDRYDHRFQADPP